MDDPLRRGKTESERYPTRRLSSIGGTTSGWRSTLETARDQSLGTFIIGTLATQAMAAGFEVLICSGDRDAFQLVNDLDRRARERRRRAPPSLATRRSRAGAHPPADPSFAARERDCYPVAMPGVHLTDIAVRVAPAVLAVLLAACGSPTTSTATGAPASTPGPVGAGLGVLPGVEGFAYREQPGIVPGFAEGAAESLDGAAEVQIVEAAVASRDADEVAVIAFGFPGATDTQAVDYMARILDGMEDAFQAGAERGLDGEGYVINFDGQTVVVAPWGHIENNLVFLFFHGPTEATTDLAAAILNAVD